MGISESYTLKKAILCIHSEPEGHPVSIMFQ